MKNSNITPSEIKNIYKIIGLNVKKAREDKNISQLKLSLAIGHKAVGTISNCELCIQDKHFNIEHLVKIANVLEVPINRFFEGID